MKKALFLFALISSGLLLQAQWLPFVNINANVENLGYSHATWGDYDNDGDLDFVIAGEPGSTIPEIRVYRNDNGTFVDINAGLSGLSYATTEWGDYDNDNDLDLLVTGQNQLGDPFTRILRNNSGSFINSGIALPAISDGQASFGDYNNDGKLDILCVGKLMAKILRNEGNDLFTDSGATLQGVQSGFCNWVDYNNDGWLDAFIAGDLGGTSISKLYMNKHGSFEESDAVFVGLNAGTSEWGDLDNDGDKDLVLAGMNGDLDGFFLLYKNEGEGQFTLIENYTFNLWFPHVDLGDYDNDGRLDITLICKIQGCGGTAVTMLYHNEGNLVFSDVSTLIQGFKRGSVAWGDYNNDGYPDLLLTGLNPYDDPFTEIYRNHLGDSTYSVNTSPSSPTGLASSITGFDATLTWYGSTDNQTTGNGFSYNVYIGTTPHSVNIVTPSANLATRYRFLQQLGNAGKDTTFTIHDLEPGTYYWGVQAIDNSFMGSAFSIEESFTVDAVGMDHQSISNITIYPNPTVDKLFFTVQPTAFELFDTFGNRETVSTISPCLIDVSSLQPGLYFVRMTFGKEVKTEKIVKL